MRGRIGIFAPVFAAFASVLFASAAYADSPPHVDWSKPHLVIYPIAAQQNGEVGVVEVAVRVKSSGKPDNPQITHSSGYLDLDNAAINTVMNWHFIPATKDGDTVADWLKVQVVFQLPQSAAPAPQAK